MYAMYSQLEEHDGDGVKEVEEEETESRRGRKSFSYRKLKHGFNCGKSHSMTIFTRTKSTPECGLWSGSISIIWEIIRNASYQAVPQTMNSESAF